MKTKDSEPKTDNCFLNTFVVEYCLFSPVSFLDKGISKTLDPVQVLLNSYASRLDS